MFDFGVGRLRRIFFGLELLVVFVLKFEFLVVVAIEIFQMKFGIFFDSFTIFLGLYGNNVVFLLLLFIDFSLARVLWQPY